MAHTEEPKDTVRTASTGGTTESLAPSLPEDAENDAVATKQPLQGKRLAFLPLFLAIVIGLGAGFLSGLFGIGGGIVIVPALVAFLHMDQRQAAATSLVSIVPTATVGALTYGWSGNVSPLAAVLLIVGALAGSQLGAFLLRKLPEKILPWTFLLFVGLVLIGGQLRVPVRDAVLTVDVTSVVALVAVGVTAGIFSGLVGVGGGSIIVPGAQLLVGLGDLCARGTSLLVMIPTALVTTSTNLRHGIASLKIGLCLGGGACLTTPLGALAASHLTPWAGNMLFSVFLLLVVVTVFLGANRRKRNKE